LAGSEIKVGPTRLESGLAIRRAKPLKTEDGDNIMTRDAPTMLKTLELMAKLYNIGEQAAKKAAS
jgi:hypothetical protein